MSRTMTAEREAEIRKARTYGCVELAKELDAERAVSAELLAELKAILPLAKSYLRSAPTHSDNGKLSDACDAIARAELVPKETNEHSD